MPAGCDTGIHGRFGPNCRYYENPLKLKNFIREHHQPKPKPNSRVIKCFLTFKIEKYMFYSMFGLRLRLSFGAPLRCLPAEIFAYFASFRWIWAVILGSKESVHHSEHVDIVQTIAVHLLKKLCPPRTPSAVDARIAPSRHRTKSGSIPIDPHGDFGRGMY